MSTLSNSLRSRLKKLQAAHSEDKSVGSLRIFIQPDDCTDADAFLSECERAANGSEYRVVVFIDHADDGDMPGDNLNILLSPHGHDNEA